MTRPYVPPVQDDEAAMGGAAVRRIRKSRRLTLEQLAQLTGIPASSLSRIENTRLRLTLDKMHLLAKALDVPVERLLGEALPDAGAAEGTSGRGVGSPLESWAAPGGLRIDRALDRRPQRFKDARVHYMFGADEARALDCAYVQFEPVSVWDSEFIRHPGEKTVYIVRGTAMAYVQGREPLLLEEGDVMHMDASVWHSVVAVNGQAEAFVTYYHGARRGHDAFESGAFDRGNWAVLNAEGQAEPDAD